MFRTLPYRHLVAMLALREQAFNGCHQHWYAGWLLHMHTFARGPSWSGITGSLMAMSLRPVDPARFHTPRVILNPELVATACAYMHAARAENTRRSYHRAWAAFE